MSVTHETLAPDAQSIASDAKVLLLDDIDSSRLALLLGEFGLSLVHVERGESIPGSYWGEPEAGVIASNVYARADTPVHSVLHEASHLIVAGPQRRASIHTDASDCDREEDATCYLQIILAGQLHDVGSARLMTDMDAWGYSFRLGSTRAWFQQDANDARDWLAERGLPAVVIAAPKLAEPAGCLVPPKKRDIQIVPIQATLREELSGKANMTRCVYSIRAELRHR